MPSEPDISEPIIDIRKVIYGTDGMLVINILPLGIPAGPSGDGMVYKCDFKSYRQYRYTNPNVNEQLERGEVFWVNDVVSPEGLGRLMVQTIDHCDVPQTCRALNFSILQEIHDRHSFNQILAPLLGRDDLSQAFRQTLEKLQASYEPKSNARRVSYFYELRNQLAEWVFARGKQDRIVKAITRLPEFQTDEGVLQLTRFLFSSDIPLPISRYEDYVYRRSRAGAEAEINTLPKMAQDTIRRGYDQRLQGVKNAILAEVGREYGAGAAQTLKQGTNDVDYSITARPFAPEETQRLMEVYTEEINQMLRKGGIADALRFIASGYNDMIITRSREAKYFHPQRHSCEGFSDTIIGNYAAAYNRTNAAVEEALLEEAAHKALELFYDNGSFPFRQTGDSRMQFLRDAINQDLRDAYDIMTFLGGEMLHYSRHDGTGSYLKEVPVKILKSMVEGRWGPDRREQFPALTAFVEKVVLADFESFHRTEHMQPDSEIIRAREAVIMPQKNALMGRYTVEELLGQNGEYLRSDMQRRGNMSEGGQPNCLFTGFDGIRLASNQDYSGVPPVSSSSSTRARDGQQAGRGMPVKKEGRTDL